MRQIFLFFIFSLILFGAACSKKTTTPTNTNTNIVTTINSAVTNTAIVSTIDPCSLLTKSEAETVFGKTAQDPKRTGTVCRYDTADSTKFFDLTAKAGTNADFETMKSLCSTPPQPVTGLGVASCGANNTVVVLKNDILMTLIAGGVFNQDQLKSLTVTAAGRIP